MELYKDNVTLITGASSGIGEALAYELARQGAWLALGARRLDNLETIAAKCRELGGKALAVQADVSQQTDCEKLVQETVKTYGRLDTLVNNAGVTMWARFGDLKDPALIEQIMKVNFLGAMYCSYYALPYLKQTQGRIANISSMADKLIAPGNTTLGNESSNPRFLISKNCGIKPALNKNVNKINARITPRPGKDFLESAKALSVVKTMFRVRPPINNTALFRAARKKLGWASNSLYAANETSGVA